MKSGIHPTWYHNATVTCACGNTFTTGSSQESLQVDICSACHPFFTGEMKFVDTQGRVDKFMQKMQAAQQKQAALQAKAQQKQGKKAEKAETKSYRQLLREQQDSLKQAKPRQGGITQERKAA
ncbi:MAG TPA: 50S ribosomal protein L31 [Patescibacteria group bacterium]